MAEDIKDGDGNGFLCPCCRQTNIVFLRISAEGVYFLCNFTGQEFVTPDKRGGYLPQRALLLKQKFPRGD